jgi:hypothetical protein
VARETPIVGAGVPDQTRLRPLREVRSLDEYLDFLAQLEAVFGPVARPRELTTGERFLL